MSKPGDLWVLGSHRLLCGDARNVDHVARLMGGAPAAMAFLDPPYNVRVRDIVGRGQVKHTEFAMASGELSRSDFIEFLKSTLAQAAAYSRDGAVHYVCMDWRHVGEREGAPLGFRQPPYLDCGDLLEIEQLCRCVAAVPGDNDTVVVNQKRNHKAECRDAVGDLTDLLSSKYQP